MILLTLFSISISFLLFRFVARFSLLNSILFTFVRVLAAVAYYPYLFPQSDQTVVYLPVISSSCNIAQTNSIFLDISKYFYCNYSFDLVQLNILFGLFSTICIAFSARVLFDRQRWYYADAHPFFNRNILIYITVLDPATLIYSSALGKDSPTYCFFLLFFTWAFTTRTLRSLLIPLISLTLYVVFFDRSYLLILLFAALLLSRFVPRFTSKLRFRYLKTLTRSNLLLISLLVPFSIIFYQFAYLKYLASRSFLSYLFQYSASMGGSLEITSYIPLPLRPFAFLFLPLPSLPPQLSSLLFGLSSFLFIYLLRQIYLYSLKPRSNLSGFRFLISFTLIITLLFGLTLSNLGIGVRYRTQLLLPLMIAFASSRTSHKPGFN